MENDPEIEGVEPVIFVDYPDIDLILQGTEQVILSGIDEDDRPDSLVPPVRPYA